MLDWIQTYHRFYTRLFIITKHLPVKYNIQCCSLMTWLKVYLKYICWPGNYHCPLLYLLSRCPIALSIFVPFTRFLSSFMIRLAITANLAKFPMSCKTSAAAIFSGIPLFLKAINFPNRYIQVMTCHQHINALINVILAIGTGWVGKRRQYNREHRCFNPELIRRRPLYIE